MTISTGNALPLAAISADIPLDAQLSDSLDLMGVDTALLDPDLFSGDFSSLLNEQMALPDDAEASTLADVGFLSSNDIIDTKNEPSQSQFGSVFEWFGAAPDAQPTEQPQVSPREMIVAPEQAQDAPVTDDDQPVDTSQMVIMAQITEEKPVTKKPLSDDSAELVTRKKAAEIDSVDPVVVAGMAPAPALMAENDGAPLPSTRQAPAPAAISSDPMEAAVLIRTPAEVKAPRPGQEKKPVTTTAQAVTTHDVLVSDEAKVEASVDLAEANDKDLSGAHDKGISDRPHKEAQRFEAMLAKHDAAMPPQNQLIRESGGLTPTGEFSAVAMMQAHNSAPSPQQPMNPATQALQLSPQATPAQWGDALGEKVSLLISNKLHSAEIRIDPPHLGKLDIQIHLKDDSATINIQTHHAPTRDLVDAASFRLRDFLQDSGYSSVDVNVSHRDQSMAQHDGGDGQPQSDRPQSGFETESSAAMGDLHASTLRQMYQSKGVIDYFA